MRNELNEFINKEQFRKKIDFVSFLTTKKMIIIEAIGFYNLTKPEAINSSFMHLFFSVGPFLLIFTLYNKTILKQKDVLGGNKTNVSLFNRFYAKAVKYVAKNPSK